MYTLVQCICYFRNICLDLFFDHLRLFQDYEGKKIWSDLCAIWKKDVAYIIVHFKQYWVTIMELEWHVYLIRCMSVHFGRIFLWHENYLVLLKDPIIEHIHFVAQNNSHVVTLRSIILGFAEFKRPGHCHSPSTIVVTLTGFSLVFIRGLLNGGNNSACIIGALVLHEKWKNM